MATSPRSSAVLALCGGGASDEHVVAGLVVLVTLPREEMRGVALAVADALLARDFLARLLGSSLDAAA